MSASRASRAAMGPVAHPAPEAESSAAGEPRLTVQGANDQRAGASPERQQVYNLIECCLNAEAAFRMLGCRVVKGRGFKPVGSLTLGQIGAQLATMPEETALVKASTAFACEFCGCPADASGEDFWICEACIARATA